MESRLDLKLSFELILFMKSLTCQIWSLFQFAFRCFYNLWDKADTKCLVYLVGTHIRDLICLVTCIRFAATLLHMRLIPIMVPF